MFLKIVLTARSFMVVSSTAPNVKPAHAADRHRVTVEQYMHFRRWGYLVVRQLLAPSEIAELRQHTEDLMQGRLPQQQKAMKERDASKDDGTSAQALEAPPAHLSPEEKAQFFLRVHMLHRQLELHERYMLHPRVLDVLEVIIGPDVLAMQTMLFLKPPGKPGQGWHQDSYYIPTHPDTLCGAWIAIDDCDEQNGAMWMAKGSAAEPVYPACPELNYGFGDKLVSDIKYVRDVSDTDDARNPLSPIADKYDQVLVPAKAGDVVFFNGHVLHRSKANYTRDRFRRSFVSHYCNARSFTQWGADEGIRNVHKATCQDPITKMTNGSHILARGDTHLPFALPKFGTPCAATLPVEQRKLEGELAARMIAATGNGLMGCAIADPNAKHDHDEKPAKPVGY
jgi:ectoine hydroxylase-related dioxygenase (phytanoyl-CoA dioxygenase family)